MSEISMTTLDFGNYMEGIRLSERERIIRVITELLSEDEENDWIPGLEYCYECNKFNLLLPDLIAEIKGEQK